MNYKITNYKLFKNYKIKIKNCLRGFTMIELLVVVSIIGVLASLIMVSFTSSQKQAKDAERKSDIRQYSTALEGFANKNGGLYPARTDASGATASTTVCNDIDITACPEDPKISADPSYPSYKYQSDGSLSDGSATATAYVLWAKLENFDGYWVVCSTGKVGTITATIWTIPTSGSCPL